MNNRNLGRVNIPCEFIDNEPERVAEVFALLKFIPLRAEWLDYKKMIEYIAISDQFEHVPLGKLIPEYQLKISQDKDDKITSVTAEKL